MCRPGWLQIHYVAKNNLELLNFSLISMYLCATWCSAGGETLSFTLLSILPSKLHPYSYTITIKAEKVISKALLKEIQVLGQANGCGAHL